MRQIAGFSLRQLIIVIALFALVKAFVLPQMTEVRQSNRVLTVAQNMSLAIQKAQSEAKSRASNVIVEQLGERWDNGWLVWVDQNDNARFDPEADTLLLEYPISHAAIRVVNRLGSGRVHFGPSGFMVSVPASHSELVFDFCEGRFGQSLKFRRSAEVVAAETSCKGVSM